MTDRAGPFLRRHWFTALVPIGAAAAAIELIVRRDSQDAPTISLWLAVPLVVLPILPLFFWRRFPFGAPAAVFVINAVASFIDGRLVPFTGATFFSVLAGIFLFGILDDRRQAIAGLGIALAAGAVVTVNDPKQSAPDYFGLALLFVVVWLAAFAIGRKLEQAAAAEE